jgi:hypothetical protein
MSCCQHKALYYVTEALNTLGEDAAYDVASATYSWSSLKDAAGTASAPAEPTADAKARADAARVAHMKAECVGDILRRLAESSS